MLEKVYIHPLGLCRRTYSVEVQGEVSSQWPEMFRILSLSSMRKINLLICLYIKSDSQAHKHHQLSKIPVKRRNHVRCLSGYPWRIYRNNRIPSHKYFAMCICTYSIEQEELRRQQAMFWPHCAFLQLSEQQSSVSSPPFFVPSPQPYLPST